MQSLLPHFPDQRHLSSLQDCRRCLGTYSIPNRIRSSLSRNHRNSARIHWSLSRTHWSLNRNHRSSARKNFHPSFPIPKASFPYRLSNRQNPTGHPANRFRSPVHFRHLHCSRFPNWNPPPPFNTRQKINPAIKTLSRLFFFFAIWFSLCFFRPLVPNPLSLHRYSPAAGRPACVSRLCSETKGPVCL